MPSKLTWDIETYSEADLKKVGLYSYAEHESTDLNCFCYKFDDGPVHAWIPTGHLNPFLPWENIDGAIHLDPVVPVDLREWVEQRGETHAWNHMFERRVLVGPAGQRYGFPFIEIAQTRCSMARARAAGLPGALEDAAEVLGCAHRKRISGVNAMRYLCKPRKDGTRPTILDEPERFVQLVAYCADDVRAEYDVDELTPPLTPYLQRIYEFDQRVNDRGVEADLEGVDNFEFLVEQYKERLAAKCVELTGIKPTRAGPLAAWIREHGFPQLENLQADTVRKALRLELPEEVKTVLKIYSTYGMKAVAKYPAIRKAVCKDGRLRGMFLVFGAGPGRFTSTIVQLHNMMRPAIPDQDVAIETAEIRDLDWIRHLWPGVDPMKVFGTCVRGMLRAARGKVLVFPDYSGVEARWNAWMFEEEWKLEVFRKSDAGTGPDAYTSSIARAYAMDATILMRDVKAKIAFALLMRQLGKVLELSMGYEGGVGAFVKMAHAYQIDLKDMASKVLPNLPTDVRYEAQHNWEFAVERGRTYELPEDIWIACEGLKLLWRQAHPRIVAGWRDLKETAIKAVQNPGVVYQIHNGRIMFKVEDRWLCMRLPNGRKIRYFRPEVKTPRSTIEDPNPKPVLFYYGINTVTRQWGRTSTYGGKLCENETQGGCFDLLIKACFDFEEANYPIVMHVHDEPVAEVPIGFGSEQEVERIVCRVPTWAARFPLAIEQHWSERYKKV